MIKITLKQGRRNHHHCNPPDKLEDGTLIFTCNLCNYRREWNPATDYMKLVDAGDEGVTHSGSYAPQAGPLNLMGLCLN